ncbi:recombinase family protein [Streptomyces wedmorensis]|uniref:Recombinase family protein n=1 Tax=Streptomyces wedmorensis TaxID=43759 RepID=A0ABW6J9I5_STRWE
MPPTARKWHPIQAVARVSTGGQKLERQLDALTAAGCRMPDVGCRKIFADKKSGRNALRPELKACHAFLDPGNTLVVPSLDRYGRDLQGLINMVAALRDRGIGFTSLQENLDTTAPGGRLVFHVFAALVEFIRELIVIGTNEGLAAARERGRVGERPSVAAEEIIRAARNLLCPTPDANPHGTLEEVSLNALRDAEITDKRRHRTTRKPRRPTGYARMSGVPGRPTSSAPL